MMTMKRTDPGLESGTLKCAEKTGADTWNDEEGSSDTDVLVEELDELDVLSPL
jgi:hypothetical protein